MTLCNGNDTSPYGMFYIVSCTSTIQPLWFCPRFLEIFPDISGVHHSAVNDVGPSLYKDYCPALNRGN